MTGPPRSSPLFPTPPLSGLVPADRGRGGNPVGAPATTADEAAIGGKKTQPLDVHLDAYDEHLQAKGVTKIHREDTGRYIKKVAADCGFRTLVDLNRERLERWLAAKMVDGMSARTRNAYRNAIVSFCNWCLSANRLTANP